MKGYGILLLIAVLFMTVLPLFAVHASVDGRGVPSIATPTEDTVLVKVSDSDQTEETNLRDATRYEAMAQIAPDAPLEAIKAQIVCVYTTLSYQKEHNAAVVTTLPYPTAFTQTYWQEQWGEHYESYAAVFETALQMVYGQQIRYDGKPIMAVTHTSNGGVTEDGVVLFGESVPYLKSVASTADMLDVNMLATVTIPAAEAKTMLSSHCETVTDDASTWFSEINKTAAGTVASVKVCGSVLTGKQVQEIFSLRSPAFEVSVQDGNVIFTVHGDGHLTGLSVCGSVGMAQNGQMYDAILKHYFNGVTVG